MAKAGTPVAPGLDHRHLRRRGGQGGVCGARHRRISRSGRGDAAARRAAELCAGADAQGRRLRHRRRDQGRRRRSRCHPRRAGLRHGARRRARRRRDVSGRRGRRHRHARRAFPLPPGEPAINPVPRPHDPRRHRRSRRRGRPRAPMPTSRSPSRAAKRSRRKRSTAGSASSAACRSSAPPDRRALFVLGVDPFDPSRHRCRARRGAHAHRRRDRREFRSRRAKALRPAGDRADRHGRLRRRHAQISAPPSGAARHHRRRRRQDDQARARPHRSALQARRGRSRGACRACRRRPAARPSSRARIVAANTAAEAFALARAEGIALGDAVARAAQATAARVVAGRDIAIEIVLFDRDGRIWSAARRSRLRSSAHRGASTEPAAIVGVVERAVAKILARRARGRRG